MLIWWVMAAWILGLQYCKWNLSDFHSVLWGINTPPPPPAIKNTTPLILAKLTPLKSTKCPGPFFRQSRLYFGF